MSKLPLPPPRDPYLDFIARKSAARSLPMPPPIVKGEHHIAGTRPLIPIREHIGELSVTKLGYDKLEVRIGELAKTLTRAETFRLIGMLERVGGSL